MGREPRVLAIAALQNGLITARQLYEIGFSTSTISKRARLGRLHRVHQGVYVVGRPELSQAGRFHAAVLALGNGAVLGYFAAAVLWQFWKRDPAIIDVITSRRVRSRDGIKVHRANLDAASITIHQGIPITNPARTVLGLSAVLYSDHAFKRMVHEAEVQQLVTPASLLEEIARSPRHRGAKRLANEIADGPKPARSGLEITVLELLRRHDFPPFEFLFKPQRVVIEADGGRYHDTAIRRALDARKQAVVEAAGYRVIRLRGEDVEPESEAQTIRRIWNGLR
jgi:hypothetical protein